MKLSLTFPLLLMRFDQVLADKTCGLVDHNTLVASQTTTAETRNASKAVDGNTEGSDKDTHVAQTLDGIGNSWSVDFAKTIAIEGVTIFQFKNVELSNNELNHATVALMNNGAVVGSHYIELFNDEDTVEINFNPSVNADSLSIINDDDEARRLNLAEVQLFGCEVRAYCQIVCTSTRTKLVLAYTHPSNPIRCFFRLIFPSGKSVMQLLRTQLSLEWRTPCVFHTGVPPVASQRHGSVSTVCLAAMVPPPQMSPTLATATVDSPSALWA